ncbi:DUF1150 family protein [uncultured Gammaproteobacteria bacterium]
MNTTLQLTPPLSSQDLATFGLNVVAYVKPVVVDGAPMFAIHAADGTPLTVVAGRDNAFLTVLQHELHPVSVH